MNAIEHNLRRNLPAFLTADKNGNAMTAAIQAALNMFVTDAQAADGVLTDPALMPELRLDEVAWENNITWYDHRAPLGVKRELVRTSQLYFGMLGTKRAIIQAVADYFGDAIVEEWWEYGGEPYHFRIYTSNADAAEQNGEKLRRIVDLVKRASAVLDGIYVENGVSTELFFAAGALNYEVLNFEMG